MSDIKVAECVADFLAKQGICHVFGIIGSANAHLFDAVDGDLTLRGLALLYARRDGRV